MKTRHYWKQLLYILSLTFCIFGQGSLICPTASGIDFEVSTSGRFVPMMELKNSESDLSMRQLGVEFSAGLVDLEYTVTSFAWSKVGALPFGDGRNTPWELLHEVSADVSNIRQS